MHIDLARARLESAANFTQLSPESQAVVKRAIRTDFRQFELKEPKGTLGVGLHVLTCQREEKSVVERVEQVNIYTPEKRSVPRLTSRLHDERHQVWEVRRHIHGSAPTIWVHELPEEALRIYLYVLADWLGPDGASFLKGGSVSIEKLLTQAFFQTVDLAGTTVPSPPTSTDESSDSAIAALEAEIIEERSSGASTKRLKELAVALYSEGGTNILRISRLTGLARDTIYRALDQQDVRPIKERLQVEVQREQSEHEKFDRFIADLMQGRAK
ncbi:hypothetical protein Sme01_51550 [Sphaerisporangium melleum]|uniref:Uncharacterized protein n=1 Tax=Sphaerisporangium melleum TaxID=321316 RepID=A0A917QYN7_9ACTN|nr:hypothetical protein [Sphaerisporangium melleum]GGK75854.1 hypothetical protein GCM10007964_18310 [Sphaerisporangium melleum]GII72679.1 hypothetical protein Sme01_51550 [Sphaerisporangium melleum]